MILCPCCQHDDSDVKDSRPIRYGVRRRRKCKSCGHRFTSYEITSLADAATVFGQQSKQERDLHVAYVLERMAAELKAGA